MRNREHIRIIHFSGVLVKRIINNTAYTESEQVCEFYVTVPLGITHSKQLPPLAGPAKNEYKL